LQALAHDVLDLTLNRVVVEENVGRSPAGGAKVKTRACDLDSRDRFWMAHKGSPFPIVAEAIQEELEQYRSSEEEVKRLKASMVGDKVFCFTYYKEHLGMHSLSLFFYDWKTCYFCFVSV
jgi:hypothetical protein